MSKLSARLADFLRASAALLESAFLGLGLPERSVVMPEPNSCCQCLITVVSADSHADDLISGTWCQNHPSHWSPSPLSMLQFRSLNNLHNLVLTCPNFLWWERKSLLPYLQLTSTYHLFNFISSHDTSHKDGWFVQIIWKVWDSSAKPWDFWTCLHIWLIKSPWHLKTSRLHHSKKDWS